MRTLTRILDLFLDWHRLVHWIMGGAASESTIMVVYTEIYLSLVLLAIVIVILSHNPGIDNTFAANFRTATLR